MTKPQTFRMQIDEDGTKDPRAIECRYLTVAGLREFDRLAGSDKSDDHIKALRMVVTAAENMPGDLDTNLTQREAHVVAQAIPFRQSIDEQKKSSFKWLYPSSVDTSAEGAESSASPAAAPCSTALDVVEVDVTAAASVVTGDLSGAPLTT